MRYEAVYRDFFATETHRHREKTNQVKHLCASLVKLFFAR